MENLSLHPYRKELLLLLYKEIESIEHTPQRVKQRKGRNTKSVQILWHETGYLQAGD